MQESNTVVNANKFTPKPGDKIICNNGEEFICCTLETLMQKYPSAVTKPNKPVLSYKERDGLVIGWQSWYESGEASLKIFDNFDDTSYDILEVIPQNVEAAVDKKEEVKEEPRYNLQEIKEAWDASGWVVATSSWNTFQKNITKINSPEYQEYLRLKAIYE